MLQELQLFQDEHRPECPALDFRLDEQREELAHREPMIIIAIADLRYRIFKTIIAIPIPISHRLMASNVPINDSFDEVSI